MALGKLESIRSYHCKKIWQGSPHAAFTDLIKYRNQWMCVFRESDKHVNGKDGILRIISSVDGEEWRSIAEIKEQGIDLRDPKFSITPQGMLMLIAGGMKRKDNKYQECQSRVSFSEDGRQWTPFKPVLNPHDWLWQVCWHQGKAYGAAYTISNPNDLDDPWTIALYSSADGINFNKCVDWDIQSHPNETTIRVLDTGEMVALVRRDDHDDNMAWIGISPPPFDQWQWHAAHHYFACGNFIQLPTEVVIAAGRMTMITPWGLFAKFTLARMGLNYLYPILFLPSFGDCGYPGLIYDHNFLWTTYYSTHEGDASIYLSKINLS